MLRAGLVAEEIVEDQHAPHRPGSGSSVSEAEENGECLCVLVRANVLNDNKDNHSALEEGRRVAARVAKQRRKVCTVNIDDYACKSGHGTRTGMHVAGEESGRI